MASSELMLEMEMVSTAFAQREHRMISTLGLYCRSMEVREEVEVDEEVDEWESEDDLRFASGAIAREREGE